MGRLGEVGRGQLGLCWKCQRIIDKRKVLDIDVEKGEREEILWELSLRDFGSLEREKVFGGVCNVYECIYIYIDKIFVQMKGDRKSLF